MFSIFWVWVYLGQGQAVFSQILFELQSNENIINKLKSDKINPELATVWLLEFLEFQSFRILRVPLSGKNCTIQSSNEPKSENHLTREIYCGKANRGKIFLINQTGPISIKIWVISIYPVSKSDKDAISIWSSSSI